MLFDDTVSYMIEQRVLVRRVLHLSHFAQIVDRKASGLQAHGNTILCNRITSKFLLIDLN